MAEVNGKQQGPLSTINRELPLLSVFQIVYWSVPWMCMATL